MYMYTERERGGVIYISTKYKYMNLQPLFPSKELTWKRRIQPQAQLPPA